MPSENVRPLAANSPKIASAPAHGSLDARASARMAWTSVSTVRPCRAARPQPGQGGVVHVGDYQLGHGLTPIVRRWQYTRPHPPPVTQTAAVGWAESSRPTVEPRRSRWASPSLGPPYKAGWSTPEGCQRLAGGPGGTQDPRNAGQQQWARPRRGSHGGWHPAGVRSHGLGSLAVRGGRPSPLPPARCFAHGCGVIAAAGELCRRCWAVTAPTACRGAPWSRAAAARTPVPRRPGVLDWVVVGEYGGRYHAPAPAGGPPATAGPGALQPVEDHQASRPRARHQHLVHVRLERRPVPGRPGRTGRPPRRPA